MTWLVAAGAAASKPSPSSAISRAVIPLPRRQAQREVPGAGVAHRVAYRLLGDAEHRFLFLFRHAVRQAGVEVRRRRCPAGAAGPASARSRSTLAITPAVCRLGG